MSKKMLSKNIVFNKFFTPTLFLGLIMILGVALRFYDLGTESFWLDEVATTIEVRQSVSELVMTSRLDQPPAYYLPIHYWAQIFGISEIGLRSFSALAGTGSIILIYLVGKQLFGKKVGLLSAFFMAISDFQIMFSQEARNYSLFEFAALLSFLFFILYLSNGGKVYFFIYIFSSIFMIYTNAYGMFILAAQNLFYILQVRKYKLVIGVWFVGQIFILLACTPYFSPILFGAGGLEGAVGVNLSGVLPSTFSDILRSLYRFILPPRRYFGADMEWGNPLIVNYAIAGVFFAIGILIYVSRLGIKNWLTAARKVTDALIENSDVKRNVLLASCWLLCPPILLFIASKVFTPMYEHRYLISAAPALYLLLALGVVSIHKMVPLTLSLGAIMILIVPGLSHYYSSDVKEQWKEMAVFIEENPIQNGVILFAPNDSSVNTGNQLKAFNYYYKGALPSCGIGPDELSDNEVWNAFEKCISNHDRFWVIIRHTTFSTTNYSRYESFFLDPNQTAFKLIAEQHFQSISAYSFVLKR